MNVYKSARNLPNVSVLEAYKPTTYEIMNADVIVIPSDAISVLEDSFALNVEEDAA
jgi:large subunit ribosomal protein L4